MPVGSLTVSRLVIDKTSFLKLCKSQQRFFFLAGHVFNELVVLRRLLLSTGKKESSKILRDARAIWGLVVLRLLAGKTWEAWRVIKKHYHQPDVSNSPWLIENESVSEPLAQIKKYFSHENVISKIRRDFGFHYSIPDSDLSNYGPDDNLEFLMAQSFSNTLYIASEVVVTSDMFDLFSKMPPEKSYDRMVNEIADHSRLILEFLNAYIGSTCAYLVEERGGSGEVTEELVIRTPRTLGESKLEVFIKDE